MNKMKIKYCVAVAVIMIAAAFCGCNDKAEVVKLGDAGMEPATEAADPQKEVVSKRDEAVVKVYVCGAVRCPDVYTLDPQMRIGDAVVAAGGFTDDAGSGYLNLAAKITDGQKIYIPTVTEVEEALEANELYTASVDITECAPGITSMTEQADTNGLVDINSADRDTLMTLPGIGQSKADKIIAYRESNGGFSSIEDIMLVAGIKEGLYNKVKDRICVR